MSQEREFDTLLRKAAAVMAQRTPEPFVLVLSDGCEPEEPFRDEESYEHRYGQ